jgi:hypothetical protein
MKEKTKIKAEGHLDKEWKSYFEDIEISYAGNNTILSGDIKDEAHLHGVLNQIRDLNLKLISVYSDEKENEKNVINNFKK